MKNSAPHYLLITEAKTVIGPREDGYAPSARSGQWRFVLEQMGYESRVEVADHEPFVVGERLELLVVVRGLEALEQPSRVTLLTASRYVGRGVRNGIAQWRQDDWRWERFGGMTPIKNADLWRRVDQAMNFHQLECRIWDFAASNHDGEPEAIVPHRNISRHDTMVNLGTDSADPRVARRTNRLSQRISLREPHWGPRGSSGQKADDTAYGQAGKTKVAIIDGGTDSEDSRMDGTYQRTNVIRPHGDRIATARRSVAPTAFATDSVVQAQESIKEQVFAHQITAAIASRPTTQATTSDRQTARTADADSFSALVKPPRAGRAYGQAVN